MKAKAGKSKNTSVQIHKLMHKVRDIESLKRYGFVRTHIRLSGGAVG